MYKRQVTQLEPLLTLVLLLQVLLTAQLVAEAAVPQETSVSVVLLLQGSVVLAVQAVKRLHSLSTLLTLITMPRLQLL